MRQIKYLYAVDCTYMTLQEMITDATKLALKKARETADTNPTQAQAEAGNYKKGHISIRGLQISIENPKGSYRKGTNKNGKEWKTLMHNDYGYFTKTVGKDGDAIDVFLGPNLDSEKVFPVDQFINGEFDETKVMLGFNTKEQAKAAYLSNYEKDWKGFKYITEVDFDTFKKWLYDGRRQRKPFHDYTWLNEDKIMINEDFSSRLLAKLAKEHGGIQISRNGGLRQFPCAFLRGHGVNPSEITDDMIIGEPFEYNPYDKKSNSAVLFNDGTAICLDNNAELPKRTSGERRFNRYGSGIGDTGDHDKTRGGFIGKGKDAESSPYNGWQSSERAGYSQSLRNAYKVNKEMGDTDTMNNIKKAAKSLVAENGKRKVVMTEAQFKNYCRHILREKRSENYLKKLLREGIDELYRKPETDDIWDKVKEAVKGTIDYMSNEGVVSYEEGNMMHAVFNAVPKYNEICEDTLWYINGNPDFGTEVETALANYVASEENKDLVEKAICDAIVEYFRGEF